MRRLLFSMTLAALMSQAALAQAGVAAASTPMPAATTASSTSSPLPRSLVPGAIALEVSLLERTFEAALAADCAPERCFPKGCVYVRHQTIDQPRSGSLPGLPVEQGIGSAPAQEYLTEARCEFTHERSINPKDIQALVRRLELRLSRGYRKVAVVPQSLEPINKSLAEPTVPPEPEEPKAEVEEPPPPPPAPPPPPPQPPLTTTSALEQLWGELLPHVGWMTAIVMLTLAIIALIWAGRRLGAPSLEEKMVLAQLNHAPPEPPTPSPVEPEAVAAPKVDEDQTFAEQQEQLWRERMAGIDAAEDGPVVELLREWLKVGDFPMLARAVFVFGDGLARSFSTDADLALKKIEFAEYFRDVDESTLPSRSEFFRRLNQHAMSSLLMSQSDVQLYRALREDFGSGGVLGLMEALPHRYAALLFALVPRDTQHDVARLMPLDLRFAVAEQLLASTRISKEESAYIFSCIGAARDGESMPKPPRGTVTDRGPSVDAASALSVLLPHLPAEQRPGLFKRALNGAGSAPQWYEDIFFGEMLHRLEPEQRSDILLDVDVRGLAAWLSMQDQTWQRTLTQSLSPSMQGAIRSNSSFSSRAEQASLARRGHQDIIKALKATYAKGKASFLALVS